MINSVRGPRKNTISDQSDRSDRDDTHRIKRLKLQELDAVMCTPTTCFAIFPAELWEVILDKAGDSKDIQSILAALPELDYLFQGKKTNWFIDGVFPHIFKQFNGFLDATNVQILLALRCVSTRWCDVIESFFKNHPARHPYNPNGINRRNVSYGQFNYIQEDAQLITLAGTEMVKSYYSKMLDHPRNPLIFGRLRMNNMDQRSHHETFLDVSLLFLKKYGHHISNFEFTVAVNPNHQFEVEEVESLFRKIFECLSFTPNVQFLKINLLLEGGNFAEILDAMVFAQPANAILQGSNYFDILENIFYAKFANVIPQLPNLDTLIVGDLSHDGDNSLSNAFAVSSWINNLKRLEVETDSRIFTNSNSIFPNLSELCLQICGQIDLDFESLDVLNKVNYPVLRKLSFTTSEYTTICVRKLFVLLARLEIEEMLLLGNWKVTNDQNCNLPPISSIKYFCVGDTLDHGFGFLKMFTSLEHLHLHFDESREIYDENTHTMRSYARSERVFSSQLRSYMYDNVVPDGVNLWDELPTVKLLTVEKLIERKDGTFWQLSRECGNTPFQIQRDDDAEYEHDYNSSSEEDDDD